MIKLFNATDKIFSNNGEKIIIPTRAIVHKQDNGEYYLDIETNLEYINDLTPNRILVANTPTGYQAFRITNVDNTKSKISLRANHVYYDSKNYVIEDSYVVEQNCNYALDHLNNATETTSPFTTSSDVGTINSFRCVRKSLFEAFSVVLERWGGHLYRDNFNVSIKGVIGADNGVSVRYGKNIKDITAEYNWDDVVTKIMPVGYDGLLLPEKYIEGVNQYDIPYTKVVHFDQDNIDSKDYEVDGELDETAFENALIGDLREKAQNYLEENSIPKVNYTLSANLERITDIGDVIEVIDERLNISLLTNIIAYDYNCIIEKYESIEFGNFKKELKNLISEINAETDTKISENNATIQVQLLDGLEEATDKILGVMGNSYVIYDGSQIMIVDSLPKETATNVMRINSAGIGFSNTGINGTFNSAWTIDGTLNMQNINVIGLTADLISTGTLKVGATLNQYGTIEVYDENNVLIATLDKNGLTSISVDGSYVRLNADEGLVGYDSNDNKIYWVQENVFHMANAEVENEIAIAKKIKIVPVVKTGTNGIGFVGIAE